MKLTGISLTGASIPEWLDGPGHAVDCLEITADGFFARPTPYLNWLGRHFPIILRVPSLSMGEPGPFEAELATLRALDGAAQSRFIVHPLGSSSAGEVRLNAPIPFSLTPDALFTITQRIVRSTEFFRKPSLIEPIAGLLRVPGSLDEVEFLDQLCRGAECRLLIDVTTVLVTSRNRGFDPHAWLARIPADLVAAVRLGGSAARRGRWVKDPCGDIDEDAWAMVAGLVARTRAEVLLVGARDRPGGVEDWTRDLARLRQLAVGPGTAGTSAASRPDAWRQTLSPKRKPPQPESQEDVAATALRSDHPPIAPGVSLFVLDDHGVFFSNTRRELSLFNPPAALVWCLLEEGLGVTAIATAYQDAFGLPEAESLRQVSTIIQRWFGLGHVSAAGPFEGDALSLTTAIAYVLTNESLRNRFRQSADAVADALGVVGEDRFTFCRLDPEELEAQADEAAFALRRPPDASTRDYRSPAFDAELNGGTPALRSDWAWERRYRLLTTTFAIRVESSAPGVDVHAALSHLECLDRSPDVVLEVRRAESGGWTVSKGELPILLDVAPQGLVPALKLLVRSTAIDRHPSRLNVHAGVVSFGGDCVLLPAAAGSGKTTLTAALIRSGATYFSDELAPLEGDSLHVSPVPLSLTIKEGSVEPLEADYPGVAGLPMHVREDHVRVRYLPPPRASLPVDDGPRPVRWLVFPHYNPNVSTRLQPLARPLALKRLLDESFVALERLDSRDVEALVSWMRTVDCFDLPFSSLETAVARVRALMQG